MSSGIIYKVTNLINSKVYIGQTRRSLIIRWKEHLYLANKQDNKFHKAIFKYGEDNFVIQVIEKVDEKLLNEREEYWIKFYNSLIDGYNSTLGGEKTNPTNVTIEQILPLWLDTYNLTFISNILHCNPHTVKKLLIENNYYIETKNLNNIVAIFNNKIIKQFCTKSDAARWLIREMKTTSKNIPGIVSTISRAINHNYTAYGYKWSIIGLQQKKRDYTKSKILQLDKNNNIVGIFSSVKDAAKAINTTYTNISYILNTGNIRSGYKWETEVHYNSQYLTY